jgi:predicted Rossmann-fold nucleotide-binding protein
MEAAAAQFDMKKLQGCAAAATTTTTTTTSVGDSGFKRICVFCGSSSGNKTVYLEVARELGTELVSTHAL